MNLKKKINRAPAVVPVALAVFQNQILVGGGIRPTVTFKVFYQWVALKH
jgi:hypothetical protein